MQAVLAERQQEPADAERVPQPEEMGAEVAALHAQAGGQPVAAGVEAEPAEQQAALPVEAAAQDVQQGAEEEAGPDALRAAAAGVAQQVSVVAAERPASAEPPFSLRRQVAALAPTGSTDVLPERRGGSRGRC